MNPTAVQLDRDTLLSAVAQMWPHVEFVERTGSTNADLLAAAAAGAPDHSVLVAEHQETGRGRLARTWVSPPGSGLTVSVLLRPTGVPPSRYGWLPLLAGLAVLDTVVELTSVPAKLKWPNDLLIGTDQRKAAGILAEVSGDAVVIGIGLNVGAAPAGQPLATSLAAEGADLDRTVVLGCLLRHLGMRESRWRDRRGDPEVLHGDYRAGCASLGSTVRVELPGGAVLTGIAEDVDSDGRLLVLDATGTRRAVAAGDVVHVRP
ncbi:MAG: biotin--[acetyl-CoA-carboxylase] ligase, partial [Pseudonocardia sp.]|nr:biotin--[acetyl-CoA-carboxylase] ligase [Pseudonocardia sp.]